MQSPRGQVLDASTASWGSSIELEGESWRVVNVGVVIRSTIHTKHPAAPDAVGVPRVVESKTRMQTRRALNADRCIARVVVDVTVAAGCGSAISPNDAPAAIQPTGKRGMRLPQHSLRSSRRKRVEKAEGVQPCCCFPSYSRCCWHCFCSRLFFGTLCLTKPDQKSGFLSIDTNDEPHNSTSFIAPWYFSSSSPSKAMCW